MNRAEELLEELGARIPLNPKARERLAASLERLVKACEEAQKFPTIARYEACLKERGIVEDFLLWCAEKANFHLHQETGSAQECLGPLVKQAQQRSLLLQHFGIDPNLLEKERQEKEKEDHA